jgi:hypothetical protein
MRHLFWSLSAFVAACGGGPAGPAEPVPPNPSAVASVTIETATTTLHVGNSLLLRVIVSDAQGHELTNRPIDFTSSDERILSVDRTGLVQALAGGTSTIEATSEGITGRTTFSVIPGDGPAWLWGMVVENSGICIVGATVTVVRGQGLGRSVEQTTPCDAWGYGAGFEFNNLTEGVEMTIHASAPGWAATEVTVVPTSGAQTALLIEPTRLP